jgi:hypothetical protein
VANPVMCGSQGGPRDPASQKGARRARAP